jgi:hypothetical protein
VEPEWSQVSDDGNSNRRSIVHAYRMEAIKTPRSTFGACGPSVWRTVACPYRSAKDCAIAKAMAVEATIARQKRMFRTFLTLRADLLVFMDAD